MFLFKKLFPKLIWIVLAICIGFFGHKMFFGNKTEDEITENSQLIQQQILQVGKLVVTEGHFSEVLTYKNQDKYFMDMISFEKKAIIVVNAEVSISYDLHQMKFDFDEKNKTITILNIPKEEIKISPDIQFYDVEQSKLNPFTGDDYNKINKSVKEKLNKKIQSSSLQKNAENRLISELSKILILSNSMGWKLIYHGKNVTTEKELTQNIKL